MRIGILTFHSQQNYGGVLQCWALKQVLVGMGHEVVVIDRWTDVRNRDLLGRIPRSFCGWLKLIARSLLGCGDWEYIVRTFRSVAFVKRLGLSKHHFCEWDDLDAEGRDEILGLDLIMVGSDQVWHSGAWGDPRAYLLENAPRIKALSYAASFGMKSIPADMVELYRRGLSGFSAISCRESEGVGLCRQLGFEATHVVDPTLLLSPKRWRDFVGDTGKTCSQCKKLVCYCIGVDLKTYMSELNDFAVRMKCDVEVLGDNLLYPSPRNLKQLVQRFRYSRVRLCRTYGPNEFVRAMASADWVLTDSFHAVMFSAIFNRNVRFLRPNDGGRAMMFARVEEFASRCVRGLFFAATVEEALESMGTNEGDEFNQKEIAVLREKSERWLKEAMDAI